MKRTLLAIALAVGTTAGVSFGQANAAPAQVTQKVKQLYPDAQTQVVNSREDNNVHVYDVRVAPKQGNAFTVVLTDVGEVIETVFDYGGSTAGLSPAVAEFTQNIWKNPPTDVREEIGNFYWVTVGGSNSRGGLAQEVGNHLYALRFDGAGRLLDMKAPSQLHQSNWRTQQDAPADVAQKLSQIAETRYKGAKIQAVKQLPHDPGFFEVRFDRGGEGWMIADQAGNISDEAYTIPVKQLPQAVQNTINDTFKGDKITWAAHDEQKFYQVKEAVGPEQLVLRIQPDGEVLGVHRDRPGQTAVPAGARQPGKAQNKNNNGLGNELQNGLNKLQGK